MNARLRLAILITFTNHLHLIKSDEDGLGDDKDKKCLQVK